ncbi:hypothetical protein [Sodalis sp. RH16]|uniref:hypothetical protein n=1 Tax=unclassified Sodalis (in: enterobacteria) TaxID=2636512 RepID=UPI0039B6573C
MLVKNNHIRLLDIALLMGLAQLGKAQAECLIRYLTQEADLLDWEALLRILIENTPRYREDMMTVAEHLKQMGR